MTIRRNKKDARIRDRSERGLTCPRGQQDQEIRPKTAPTASPQAGCPDVGVSGSRSSPLPLRPSLIWRAVPPETRPQTCSRCYRRAGPTVSRSIRRPTLPDTARPAGIRRIVGRATRTPSRPGRSRNCRGPRPSAGTFPRPSARKGHAGSASACACRVRGPEWWSSGRSPRWWWSRRPRPLWHLLAHPSGLVVIRPPPPREPSRGRRRPLSADPTALPTVRRRSEGGRRRPMRRADERRPPSPR